MDPKNWFKHLDYEVEWIKFATGLGNRVTMDSIYRNFKARRISERVGVVREATKDVFSQDTYSTGDCFRVISTDLEEEMDYGYAMLVQINPGMISLVGLADGNRHFDKPVSTNRVDNITVKEIGKLNIYNHELTKVPRAEAFRAMLEGESC